jgi:hypothetical protein
MNILAPNTALILALVVSIVIPLVAALLTRAKIPANVTGVITMFLAAVNGFATEWAQSSNATHYDWKSAAGISLFSFIVAVASHYGVWKSTTLEAQLLAVGSKTAEHSA